MSIPQETFDYIRDYLESYSQKELRDRLPCYLGIATTPEQEDIDTIMDGVRERIEEMKLSEEYGWWGVHPKFPREDWVNSVRDGDTNTGYWQWVAKQITVEGD